MKKISSSAFIVPDKLAAFIYEEDEGIDIFHKLLNLWNDVEYVFNFYQDNEKTITLNNDLTSYGYDFDDFSEDIMQALEQLENFIEKLTNSDVALDDYFHPLDKGEENNKILRFNKKKCKWLRIYAIRIDKNLYVITGGAIKITKKMQGHKGTKNELAQLNYNRDWLNYQGVGTNESFYLQFDL